MYITEHHHGKTKEDNIIENRRMITTIPLGRLVVVVMAVLCCCRESFLSTTTGTGTATFVAAFPTPERIIASSSTRPPSRHRFSDVVSRMVLYDPFTNEEHAESLWVDFPTSQQRTLLKKEASKRRARKTLPTYKMPSKMSVSVETLAQALEEAATLEDDDEEDDEISEYYDLEEPTEESESENETEDEEDEDEDDMLMLYEDQTLDEIWQELRKHEVVQLKGVCSESRKYVYSVATWICAMLEERQDGETSNNKNDQDDDDIHDDMNDGPPPLPVILPVTVLETKGHTCLLYCPTLPLDHKDKFLTLRTSVGQKNSWTRREKAPRDNRGQIIEGWKRQQKR